MEKIDLVDKLRTKTNITYEEAKAALENSNWDILEAMVYLENLGRIEKPSRPIFYTNDYKEDYGGDRESSNSNEAEGARRNEGNKGFNGVFEAVCKAIDTFNNIFLEIKRNKGVILRLPLTVLVLLLFFGFWFVIPLMAIGLFFDIEYSIETDRINRQWIDEVNKFFKTLTKYVLDLKEKFKKGSDL